MIKVAIRMDDISEHMDWEKFKRVTGLLERYGIKPLLGVVPDCKDGNLNRGDHQEEAEDFWPYMKRLRLAGYVIAQHGLHHLYETKKGGLFPLNHLSEFAGLPLEEQKGKLKKGMEIMASHGLETKLFMAPAHSYDRNTLRALRELGFLQMTDGFGLAPYKWNGITFYPISFRRKSSLKQKTGVTTMVLHCNTMGEQEMNQLEDVLKHRQVISFGEYLVYPAVQRGAVLRGVEYGMALSKWLLVRIAGIMRA